MKGFQDAYPFGIPLTSNGVRLDAQMPEMGTQSLVLCLQNALNVRDCDLKFYWQTAVLMVN